MIPNHWRFVLFFHVNFSDICIFLNRWDVINLNSHLWRHFNSYGHIMAVGDAYVFPGFLTPVLTKLFFPKPPTTFRTCFCRGERRKYARKKIASTGNRTHNHQVISPTRSSLSHASRAHFCRKKYIYLHVNSISMSIGMSLWNCGGTSITVPLHFPGIQEKSKTLNLPCGR